MLKVLIFFVLLTVIPHLAFAGIYRCEDADRKLIFTDNPSNLPPGCQVEYAGDMPALNVLPSPQAPSVKKKTSAQSPAQIDDKEPSESVANEYDILKGEAESLVERFVAIRKRVYRSTKVRSKIKARKDLKEVKSQKSPMLKKIDKSTLSRSQKKTVREILSNITDE
jgi:hypothetical protein